MTITVLKLGGSVLGSRAQLADVVHEIYRELRQGRQVVAVVSAWAGTTDRLLAEVAAESDDPEPRATAALLATGEANAAAWLALALDRAGVSAAVLDASTLGLTAKGRPLDAAPVGLDVARLHEALAVTPVVVVPGFVGRFPDGSPALFGRGGSDLTALFVAHALGAEHCRLIKDVDGLYERDPKVDPAAQRYRSLSWAEALTLGGGIVQTKALAFAQQAQREFSVGRPGGHSPTRVGDVPVLFDTRWSQGATLRVALAGLGTVGGGVAQALLADPSRFEITAVLVRDVQATRLLELPNARFTDDIEEFVHSEHDVLVELIGGLTPATALVEGALRLGRSVVTANKRLLAESGEQLAELARVMGGRLLGSASVGGALPALEWVSAIAATGEVGEIVGVLNGTTNAILDSMAAGVPFDEALKEAQRRGFAEADPTADLSGADVADKLTLLARAALGDGVSLDWTALEGLHVDSVSGIVARGRVPRLVARWVHEPSENGGHRCRASVRMESLAADDPLAQVHGERNRLTVSTTAGKEFVLSGRGAGRWPTTESVLGDLSVLAARHGLAVLRRPVNQAC